MLACRELVWNSFSATVTVGIGAGAASLAALAVFGSGAVIAGACIGAVVAATSWLAHTALQCIKQDCVQAISSTAITTVVAVGASVGFFALFAVAFSVAAHAAFMGYFALFGISFFTASLPVMGYIASCLDCKEDRMNKLLASYS